MTRCIFKNSIIEFDIKEIVNSGIDWSRLNNKTIFITGGTGMLASYMIYVLIYLNESLPSFRVKIIMSIRDKSKCYEKFGEYADRNYLSYYTDDINEKIVMDEKIDFIVHAASIAMTQFFSTCPIEVILPNTSGTYNLLKLAEKNDSESFLFFSTCSIYGKIESTITEETCGTLDSLDVNSCYSESKRLGETLCKAFFTQKRVRAKIARIAHTYGPTMNLKEDKRVFAEFIDNVINNEDIVIKSDGMANRCFCYLSDAVIGFFLILLKGKDGEAYNLCNTEQQISIKDLAHTLVEIFPEKKMKVIQILREKNDSYIEYKFANTVYESKKLFDLGWKPKVSIRDGFKRTILSLTK